MRLSVYAFAYRDDRESPMIMHASKPFAEVSYDLALEDAKLDMLASEITDLSIQGIQPIAPAEIKRLQTFPPLPKLFTAALDGPLSQSDEGAIRELYEFQEKCHSAAVHAIRSRHRAFFEWLDAKCA